MSGFKTLQTIVVALVAALAMVLGASSSASATTATEEASVQVESIPFALAISPNGLKAYVGNTSVSGTVSVIDIASKSVVRTIPVGSRPYGIAFTPDGTKAYVANRDSNNVSVINVITDSVISTITVGSQPYGVAMSLDGSQVYVANNGSDTVSVISTSSDTVTNSISVPAGPIWLATNPVSGNVYVSSMTDEKLTTISGTAVSGSSLSVTGAYSLAVTPDGTQVYVASYTGNISVVSVASYSITNTIVTGADFFGMAFVPSGEFLLYPKGSSSTLNRITVTTGLVTPGDGFPLSLSQNSASNVAVTSDCTTALVVTPNYPYGFGQGYVSIVSTGLANCALAPTPSPTPAPALATTSSPLAGNTQGALVLAALFAVFAGAGLVLAGRQSAR